MAWYYTPPDKLNPLEVDEPLRDLIAKINRSNWLRTEESCAGHPDRLGSATGAWGTDIYLRLVVIKRNFFTLTRLFSMVDACYAGIGKMSGWSVSLQYDREDEDGIHFYFKLKYNEDIQMRKVAIEIVEREFAAVDGLREVFET